MLMYGLSLRHGWGCPRNEKSGFHWLKKAAELAITDLEKGKQGVDAMAIRVSPSKMQSHGHRLEALGQSELILAIYEVGQSFYQGWGVPKDKKMGVVSMRVFKNSQCLPTAELFPSCGQAGRPRRTAKPCVLPCARKRV